MKIENRQQMLVVVTVAALGLLVADQLIIEPLTSWYGARNRQITELRTQVRNGKSLIIREAGIRGHWDQMRTNALPAQSAVAEQQVFSALDRWSRYSLVEITGILPQWKNDSDDYQTLNCRVEATGTLSTLTRFLYNVETGPLPLKVEAIELAAKDTGGQQLSLGLQVSGLALSNPIQP